MDIKQLSGQHFDEYRLESLLGQGGMSAVYRAYQEELDRYVAIKVLSPQFQQDAGYNERFIREAKMAASLEHPHIIPLYDYGTHGEMSYVVMRLLNGGTLAQRPQPMGLQAAAGILDDIAKALDYAHKRGLVHRDVKPSNIMFDEQGTVYLVDFGIAKALGSNVGLTADNTVLGTPPYMPPEQWQDNALTPAVDQYALAAVMYLIVTGKSAFEGATSAQIMYQHLNTYPPFANEINHNIPPAAGDVLQRALAKNPADRFASVMEFARAFNDSLRVETTVRAVPSYAPPPAERTMQSQRPAAPAARSESVQPSANTAAVQVAAGGMIGFTALVIGAIIVALGVFFYLRGQNTPQQDNTPTAEAAAATEEAIATTSEVLIGGTLLPDEAPNVPVSVIDFSTLQHGQILHRPSEVPVRDAAISPDGSMIASAHGDGVIRVWEGSLTAAPMILSGHTGVVWALDFSPDSSLLVSGGADGTVRVWNVRRGELITTFSGHSAAVRDVVFSPDGARIASAAEDSTLRVWNLIAGGVERTIDTQYRRLAVAFSPDGLQLASSGSELQARIWDVAAGTQQMSMAGHTEEVRSVAFSPDGTLLATSSTDDSIRIWNLGTRQTLFTLQGHGRDVWIVTFSPDGALLASGGRDNNLRLWNVSDGTQASVFSGHSGWVLGVEFSPDGTVLVTGSGDGSVRLWRVNG